MQDGPLRGGAFTATALLYGLAGALAAVLTSSLFYNAYFEDPASWILTALIVSVAALPNIRFRQAPA